MPIREFCCERCGNTFETLIFSRRDEAEQKCPKCRSKRLRSLFSVFGVAGADKPVSTGNSCGTCSTHQCSTCH